MNSHKENKPNSELINRSFFERHYMLLVGIVIAAGLLFRIIAYLHNRSLYLDEALVACSIVRRSFVELLHPLDFNQAAPIGWLYLVRTATAVFGPNEYALRLVSFLAGLAALPLFYFLAKRYVNRTSALIGLTLFAVSENLIYYSTELKQYSTDALIAILIILAAEPIVRGSAKRRHWIILAAGGAFAIWFSHPVVFVMAGIGTVLAIRSILRRDWQQFFNLAIVGMAWLASFGLNYALITRHLAANSIKQGAFAYTFMPLELSLETLEWFRWAINGLAERALKLPTNMGCTVIGTLMLIVGTVRLCIRKKTRGTLILSPILFCLAASAMQKYPFRGRLLLFLTPILLVLIGLGAQWFISSRRRLGIRIFGGLMIAILLVMPTIDALIYGFKAYGEQEFRPVMEYVMENKEEDDVVCVWLRAYPSFVYYREAYGYDPERYAICPEMPGDPNELATATEKLFRDNGPRMWFIFCVENGFKRERLIDTLDQVADRQDSYEYKRGGAYLYEIQEAGEEKK